MSSFDLLVPLPAPLRWSADAEIAETLAAALGALGLAARFPAALRLPAEGLAYLPAELRVSAGVVVHAGVTVDVDPRARGDEAEALQGQLGVFANDGPGAFDPNAVVLAFFVAGHAALATGSAVLDPQSGRRYEDAEAIRAALADRLLELIPESARARPYPFALLRALEGDDVDALRGLLDADPALLETPDEVGNTPLMLALACGCRGAIDLFLERGAALAVENGYGKSVLHAALDYGERAITARVLDATGAGPATLLRFAANGYTPGVRALHAAGVSLELASPGGWTPLMLATYGDEGELFTWLLEAGVELERENQDGATALMIAADHGRAAMVERLLARGADASHRARDGATAADWAEKQGFGELAARLRGTDR